MPMVPWVTAYIYAKYRVRVEGIENIPDGPAMLVANHLIFDDSLAIAAIYANAKDKPLRLGAKAEYFEGGGINDRHWFGKPIQKFVTDTRQLPIYRESNRRGNVDLAKEIKSRFDEGEAMLFHAEGTRSPDGRLNKFKLGAAAFAIKNSVPLVPVSIMYPDHHPLRRPIAEVKFGEPLLPEQYGLHFHHYPFIPDGIVDAVAPRMMRQSDRVAAVTDVLESRVAELSGQEQSGVFIDPYTKEAA